MGNGDGDMSISRYQTSESNALAVSMETIKRQPV